MNCYLCNLYLSNESFVSKHFKLLHNKKENGVYKCTFENCGQYVANMRHFKKHFQNHLSIVPTSSSLKAIPSSSTVSSMAEQSVEPVIQNSESETISSDKLSTHFRQPNAAPLGKLYYKYRNLKASISKKK